jgi:mannosyltransferase OCH1-like enzyme
MPVPRGTPLIPRRLVRTVPTASSAEAEELWSQACALHPDWEHVTWRDPVTPEAFPLTSPYWTDCETGAQLADLIRAEDLYHRGGWYIDSDVHILKPFDDLCALNGVAAWEDRKFIPNAVLGFTPGHPALKHVIDQAVALRHEGTWAAGVGVTTEVFQHRTDVTLLPPGSFYPVHWRAAHNKKVNWEQAAQDNPWAYCLHKYRASWHHA